VDPLSLGPAAALVLGIVLTILNIREKLWPKPSRPHPLAAALVDIAAAIRERYGPSPAAGGGGPRDPQQPLQAVVARIDAELKGGA
jgi:hypothetical protein